MSEDHAIDPDRWVDDHGDALHAYAMLRLRDSEAAAEVVQETFLEALRSRDRFQGRSTERTWLIGILKHKTIDRFRSRAHRSRAVGGDDVFDSGEFFNERGGWKTKVELPDFAIERAEFWEMFRSCLAELPASYADAFTLAELEGLPGPEVCKILEITPTNLWARLHRARLMLRRSLNARWLDADSDSR